MRPSKINNGCSPCSAPDPFWSADARSYDCGFGIDTSRSASNCDAQRCGCKSGCGMGPRDVNAMFEDIALDSTYAPAFGDDLLSTVPLQSTNGSYLYSLRCAPQPASAAGDCDLYQSSWSGSSVKALVRLTQH